MSSGGLYPSADDWLDDLIGDSWREEREFRAGYIKAVRANRPLRRSSFTDFEWNLIMSTKGCELVDELVTEINRNDDAEDAAKYSLTAATLYNGKVA